MKGRAMTARDDWMNRKWRPLMGWLYFSVCITDFILFPLMWSMFKAYMGEGVDPWNPLTLQGAGMFHLAMGAVLGVSAWSRGQEKIAGVSGAVALDPSSNTQPLVQNPFTSQAPNIKGKPVQEDRPEL